MTAFRIWGRIPYFLLAANNSWFYSFCHSNSVIGKFFTAGICHLIALKPLSRQTWLHFSIGSFTGEIIQMVIGFHELLCCSHWHRVFRPVFKVGKISQVSSAISSLVCVERNPHVLPSFAPRKVAQVKGQVFASSPKLETAIFQPAPWLVVSCIS